MKTVNIGQQTPGQTVCHIHRKNAGRPHGLHRQQGYSLLEIGVVSVIIMLIAAITVPRINDYVIENRVTKVGEEMQRYIARAKTLAEGTGVTPYANIATASNLLPAVEHSSVLRVDRDNSVVYHRIGDARQGKIELASSQLDGTAGDAFTLTFSHVSDLGCPGLATIMQSVSDSISINGTAVKTYAAGVQVPYDPVTAQQQCTRGNTNTFIFTAK